MAGHDSVRRENVFLKLSTRTRPFSQVPSWAQEWAAGFGPKLWGKDMRASVSSLHRAGWFAIAAVACIGCTGAIGPPPPTPQGTGGATGRPARPPAAGNATGTGATTGTAGTTGAGATTGTAGTTGVTVDPTVAACAASNNALNAGLTPARRLTRDEFNNTVRELLGATGSPADDLGDDERIGPFRSNAIIPLDELQVQKQSEVANKLAVAAKPNMRQIATCDLAADTGTTCATTFVTAFGLKAYRRPAAGGRDHEVRQPVHGGAHGARGRRQRFPSGRRGLPAIAVLPVQT